MTVEIALDSDGEWDSSGGWEQLAKRAVEAAIAESRFSEIAGSPRLIELSIRLTDDDEVRALNAQWRGKDKPTNVLSFPMASERQIAEGAQEGPALLLGDIVLAAGICAAEAREKGVSVSDHAAHLIIHGTLHLLGYDHEEDGAADDMEEREKRALTRLGIANPYLVAG